MPKSRHVEDSFNYMPFKNGNMLRPISLYKYYVFHKGFWNTVDVPTTYVFIHNIKIIVQKLCMEYF